MGNVSQFSFCLILYYILFIYFVWLWEKLLICHDVHEEASGVTLRALWILGIKLRWSNLPAEAVTR